MSLTDTLVTPVRYANFGPRLLAAFLDFLFTLPLFFAAFYYGNMHPNFNLYVVIMLVSACYKFGMEKLFGATLGKLVTKLRVVDADGGAISWSQALMRYLPWMLGLVVSIYFVYVMFQVPGYTDIDGFTEYGKFIQEYQKNNDTSMTSLLQILSVFLPLVSALLMLGNKKRQAAHDTLAETFVIHTNPPPEV